LSGLRENYIDWYSRFSLTDWYRLAAAGSSSSVGDVPKRGDVTDLLAGSCCVGLVAAALHNSQCHYGSGSA